MLSSEIDIRKTHPNLYWLVMTLAVMQVALAFNFFILQPTFQIWGLPNFLWGSIFLVIGVGKIAALNFYRRVRLVRGLMIFAVAYMGFLAIGTGQPWLQGNGSLQLPLLYGALCLLQIPLIREPFINLVTAK